MDKSIFDIIGATIIICVWSTIAFIAVKEYLKLIKIPGVNLFMSKKDISRIKDPEIAKRIASWNKLIVRLFIIWTASCIIYIIAAIIINKSIGFK